VVRRRRRSISGRWLVA